MKRALLAAAIVTLGAFAFWLSRDENTNTPPATDVATTGTSNVNTASEACRFEVGNERAWRVREKSTVKLDAVAIGITGAPDGVPDSIIETTATLQAKVLSVQPDKSAVLLAKYADVNDATKQQLGESIEAPFLVRVASDCSLNGYARLKGNAVLPARSQQALMQELWFAVPVTPSTVEVEDGAGRYSANVAADAMGARRRMLNYISQWQTAMGTKGALVIDDALLTVERDEGTWFRSMRGHTVLSGQALARAERTLEVDAQPSLDGLLDGAPHDADAYVWEDLLPVAYTQDAKPLSAAERREREQLARLSLEDAFERFATRVEAGTGFNQQWPLLRDYLEARPDQIPVVAEALESGDIPSDAQPAVFLALGKTRAPEARDALLGINRNDKGLPLHRVQSALLLADRNDTPPIYAKELRAATQTLSRSNSSDNERLYGRNAVLALTVFAARQGDRDESIRAEAHEAVAEMLKRGNTSTELSPAFGAMGNLGDVSMLPEIRMWSQHDDANVRAAVPMALRRLTVEQETPLVQEWMGREKDPTVRRELWSLLYRQLADEQRDLPQEYVAAAVTELRGQPGLLTRQPLVRLLVSWAQRDANVKQALLEQVLVEVRNDSGLMNVLQLALSGDEVAAKLRRLQPEGTP